MSQGSLHLNLTAEPVVERICLHTSDWSAVYLLGPESSGDGDRWALLCWREGAPMHLEEMPDGVFAELEQKAAAWLVGHRFQRPATRLRLPLYEQRDRVEMAKALHAGRLHLDDDNNIILHTDIWPASRWWPGR